MIPESRTTTWTRALSRRRRALYLSSPIGLGHAQRDVALADELRKLRPDLEIDWLAQHPVTTVLESRGERIHPMSAELASESAHFAAESSGHDLNAFQAIRRMDEILVANFMVFHDAVTDGEYDLVIGDEAWEVDHFLHENPELKRTAFAWLTDFVGWLPMPEGGEREAYLTADYNAEMIEHIERFPRIRDRAIFVGEPDDIVPDDFGPGMPSIRDWTERHFAFSGYVTGFDPTPLVKRREELRRELGYHADERVVIVTVGGSGVGAALLRRVIASYPEAARRVNGLRMIAVAGPNAESLVSLEGNYNGTASQPILPLDGLRKQFAGTAEVLYAQGSAYVAELPVPVPCTVLHADGSSGESGLKGEYFANPDFSGKPGVVRVDPQIQFNWNAASPAAGIPTRAFAVRWSGTLTPPGPGEYTFGIEQPFCWPCEDKETFRVYLDDRLVMSGAQENRSPAAPQFQEQAGVTRRARANPRPLTPDPLPLR